MRAGRTNLRAPTSSFVGREAELETLRALFADARLVTLLGPGGMGKTRLALRFAATMEPAYEEAGGVWLVGLAQIHDEDGLAAAVGAVVGADLSGADRGEGALRVEAALRRRGPTLLVLDNFEQLVGAAPVVERWLEGAPEARFLVTSRIALDIRGEQRSVLEPLSPAEASALFVGRARSVDPTQALDDPEEIAAIVGAIDRMPLAIELAASRTRVLSLPELRARLDRPLDVLRRPRSDDRHGSVRRAIHDSLALLAPAERDAFALLSILENGFRADDAEAVLGDVALPRVEVLDALDELTRASLLRTERRDEALRYGLFETMREVANELAAPMPEREEAVRAHARRFAARAREGSGELEDGDVENLLAAHRACVERAADPAWAADALALARALDPVLTGRGRLPRKLEVLEATARVPGLAAPDVVWLHLARGRARREVGDTAAARLDLEEALRRAQDGVPRAEALLRLGALDDVVSETGAARARYVEALDLLDAAPSTPATAALIAEAQRLLGHAHRREGALDEAARLIHAAAAHARATGDDAALADALYEIGVVDLFAGRFDDALAVLDEGREVARRAGIPVMEGAMINARGCLLQDLGRPAEALEHHGEAARLLADCGSRHREGSALFYLGTAYLELDEPGAALEVLGRARERLEPVHAARYDALVSSARALAHARRGEADLADAELARAKRALDEVDHEPALEAALTLHRAYVKALRGEPLHDIAEARALVEANGSDDARFALRMLERAGLPATAHGRAPTLVVWPDGAAFQPPGTDAPVALPERSPLRGLLHRLVRARIEAPGAPVSLEELVRAGWPGERISAESALNRVYVALTTLRKKGLRDVLERVAGGYALSVGVVLRVNDE